MQTQSVWRQSFDQASIADSQAGSWRLAVLRSPANTKNSALGLCKNRIVSGRTRSREARAVGDVLRVLNYQISLYECAADSCGDKASTQGLRKTISLKRSYIADLRKYLRGLDDTAEAGSDAITIVSDDFAEVLEKLGASENILRIAFRKCLNQDCLKVETRVYLATLFHRVRKGA